MLSAAVSKCQIHICATGMMFSLVTFKRLLGPVLQCFQASNILTVLNEPPPPTPAFLYKPAVDARLLLVPGHVRRARKKERKRKWEGRRGEMRRGRGSEEGRREAQRHLTLTLQTCRRSATAACPDKSMSFLIKQIHRLGARICSSLAAVSSPTWPSHFAPSSPFTIERQIAPMPPTHCRVCPLPVTWSVCFGR